MSICSDVTKKVKINLRKRADQQQNQRAGKN